jgi:hypothetical protein
VASAGIVYPYIYAAKPLYGSIPQTLDLIIMAHITEVRQYLPFVVFGSQHSISFVQVRLGMTADSDSTSAGQERIGKAKSYPAGAPRNHNTFHLPLISRHKHVLAKGPTDCILPSTWFLEKSVGRWEPDLSGGQQICWRPGNVIQSNKKPHCYLIFLLA